ncbi:phosphate signaling complex protein PhoU [Sphingobium sufflavum]|uniref:phosphate signaling complex protein PhoU n=1 Tax=Sphingobium sufflavum TaxID=1129547 RepID=UPI001F34FBBB|nr:phosphate signaling complex protein PhoU [Sphingobium sufflavum]MCE7795813.1 phosphate signaling complex protein PhoU [Sphingobium sufflavum]
MAEHTLKAFDDDIGELRALIAEMGGRAEAAIDDALVALSRRDNALAERVVEGDKAIDELEALIEKKVVQVIALRAPMADDLREIIAALKIVGVVERIGDYAKNIAKRVPLISHRSSHEPLSLLPAMGQIAREMVKGALDAFAARDAQKALWVMERDRAVDDFYNSIFRTMVTFMMENPKTISESAHILFIAKNLERVGDHATNVAEMVYYAATGAHPPERERGPDLFQEQEG